MVFAALGVGFRNEKRTQVVLLLAGDKIVVVLDDTESHLFIGLVRVSGHLDRRLKMLPIRNRECDHILLLVAAIEKAVLIRDRQRQGVRAADLP